MRDCPLRGQSNDSARGSEVERYDDEESRELMAKLLNTGGARRSLARVSPS